MSKSQPSIGKKIILEVPNNRSKAQLESKGGAIPPTKVSVQMPPVKKPKDYRA